jgi:hypothetical protein
MEWKISISIFFHGNGMESISNHMGCTVLSMAGSEIRVPMVAARSFRTK